MADNSEDHPLDDNEVLDRIIRNLRHRDEDFVRPDPSIISAYLMGTATDEDKKTMQAALASSAAFRREILQMAEDMDALAAADLAVDKKKDARIEVPSRAEFLARYGECAGIGNRRESLWAKLKRFRIIQVYVPAAATVAAVVLILAQTGVFRPERAPVLTLAEWSMEAEQVDPGLLIATTPRAATSHDTPEVYSSPEDATFAEFRQMLAFKDGGFSFKQREQPLAPSPPFSSRFLRIVDDSDSLIRALEFQVPMKQGRLPTSLQAWALALDTMSLHALNVRSDTTTVTWPDEMGRRIAVTVTYTHNGDYQALPGYSITR